jgi:Family of unknown function (DUF5317)
VIGLLLPSAIAAIFGFGLRRNSRAYARFEFQWWGLVVIAFGIELILYNPPVDATPFAQTYGPWLWVATRIALLVAVMRNVHTGTGQSVACLVVAAGICLNTIVIVANDGYMPQSITAATAVWGFEPGRPHLDAQRLQNTRPMDTNSRLGWLADVLPEPRWLPRANVVSIGDVVVAMGMAGWIISSFCGAGPTDSGGDSGSIADVELDEHVLDVRLNRLHRHHQLVGDRPI